jgi:hypothetical protein
MSDNIDKPQGGETDKPQGGDERASQGDAKQALSQADLLAKIDELEKDNRKYRQERKAQETATKQQQEQQLADQEKWKELAESRGAELLKLQPVAEQHEAITAAFNASLDNRLKQIPDDVRKKTVDPVRATMTPAAFSNWLDANLDILRSRQAPPLDGGAGTSASGTAVVITQEIAQLARYAGMKPEDYIKQQKAIEEQHKKNLQT